jgi:polysaccharide export outer membrane protein
MDEKSTKNSGKKSPRMLAKTAPRRPGILTFGLALAVVAMGAFSPVRAQPAAAGGGQAAAPAAPAPAVPTESDDNYLIGPGDTLNIFVWRNEDLTTTVAVRPDGKISIPLVNDMPAVGKTPSKLAADIEKVLGEFVRSPDVTVIVAGFGIGAFGNQVRIVGAGAVKPQAIPYRQGLTLLDVMIEVGLSEFAAGDRAKLVRRTSDGGEQEIKVKLNKLVNRGDLSQNLSLQPGDVVIIPQSRF